MVRPQINRSVLVIGICSLLGVILGGTTAWADSVQCVRSENPTDKCLTQDPKIRTVEGMATGFLAGAGAAVGATWKLNRKP